MDFEEGEVEVNKIDLGSYLIHFFNMVLPCGYTNLMVVYRIERKNLIHLLAKTLFIY
jgi:hypothetical protein